MGFYIRKSVSVGPFRLNLSKSGLGLSVGVKGFRVGIGPAGQYVHMGRGGIYYRKTFSARPQVNHSTVSRDSFQAPTQQMPDDWSLGPMSEFRSVDSLKLMDSDSKELIDELNAKKNLTPLFPFAAAVALILLASLLFMQLPFWLPALLALPSAFGLYWLHQRDEVRKTTALFYTLDGGDTGPAFERLCASFETFTRCDGTWRMDGKAKVLDRKYHAGAGHIVGLTKIVPSFQEPPGVRSNIPVPVLPLAENTLYFFPDRILVRGRTDGWGAIGWDQLTVSAHETRFIESGTVPHDTEIVDHTWSYVNKNGSPDRRFSNNRQIPVCRYGFLEITSTSGLHEFIYVSRPTVAIDIESNLSEMAEALIADKELTPSSLCGKAKGIPQDLVEATRLFKLASDQGNALVHHNLAAELLKGERTAKNCQEAARLLRLAAEQGRADSQVGLGEIFFIGLEGVPENWTEAVRLFDLAAEQGNSRAQFNLGRIYEQGTGVPKNEEKAVFYYQQSANQGNSAAQANLASMYKEGRSVNRDFFEAFRLFVLAANSGLADPQFEVGEAYELGNGTVKDEVQAVYWFRLAAKQGQADAQNRLKDLGLTY